MLSLMFMMLIANLNFKWYVRVVLIFINTSLIFIASIGLEIFQQQDKQKVWAALKQISIQFPYVFVSINIALNIYSQIISNSIQAKLNVLYQRHKRQTEHHLTLQTLDSGIITFTDSHLKYFNQAGRKIIDEVIGQIDDL